jgi:hypothetical protein
MADRTEEKLTNRKKTRLADAGISDEMLRNAAATAALWCDQSAAADGSVLAPCHFADFQQLFRDLAEKAKP